MKNYTHYQSFNLETQVDAQSHCKYQSLAPTNAPISQDEKLAHDFAIFIETLANGKIAAEQKTKVSRS